MYVWNYLTISGHTFNYIIIIKCNFRHVELVSLEDFNSFIPKKKKKKDNTYDGVNIIIISLSVEWMGWDGDDDDDDEEDDDDDNNDGQQQFKSRQVNT